MAEPRVELVAAIKNDLSIPAVTKAMVGEDRSWKAVASFCEQVMIQKQSMERMREDDASSHPIRRRRVGRRRQVYERRLST